LPISGSSFDLGQMKTRGQVSRADRLSGVTLGRANEGRRRKLGENFDDPLFCGRIRLLCRLPKKFVEI